MATADLFAHPDNPLPPLGSSEIIRTADGIGLRVARWKPTGRRASNGTVLVVQGRAEFIERWFETIQDLRRRGFHVVAFDWRGQGGSDRLTGTPGKGHVRRFRDYHRDLGVVLRDVMGKLPRPHFGLAHSMGAALLLEAASEGQLPLDRLVALAPMFRLSIVERERAARNAAAGLDMLGFGRAYVPAGREVPISTRPFEGNKLSSDRVRYERNATLAREAPHLTIGDPTVRWVNEAFRFMTRMAEPNRPLAITVPVLVIAAGADPIVSTPAIELFAARLKTGSALVLPGARHEIVMENEAIRSAFWAAFDAFVPGESPASAGEAPEDDVVKVRIT